MKTRITLLALISVLFFQVNAQDASRWNFGLLAGPHFSVSVPRQGNKWVAGAAAALDVGYRFQSSPKGWSAHFQPGYNRFKNSVTTEEPGTTNVTHWDWKGSALYLPLLVRYTFLGGKIRPFAEAGANWRQSFAWRYHTTGQHCFDDICYVIDDRGTVKFDEKKDRLGALAAAGVEIDLGKVTIPLKVQVIENLRKKETFLDPTTGNNIVLPKTRVVQVLVGVNF